MTKTAPKNDVKKIIPFILLLIYFITGICIYQDYGATADEPIQIQAGHIIWRYICIKFGFPVPEAISGVEDLHNFKNRYYGQAATFPTVILESINDFSLDSSTIIRVRHLWNFLCFFLGICLFSITIYKIYGNWLQSTFTILFIIFLPRIFGDVFYNDRDIMLMSWMMISLCAFYVVTSKKSIWSVIICSAAFGLTFNTRIFGLVLLIFPFLFFIFTKNKKIYFLLSIISLLFWFIYSPIAWENPIKTIPEAFIHFATQQRHIDTLDGAQLLFFGKLINETQLPWYYIPVYILVTTPVITSLAAVIGIVFFIRRSFLKNYDTYNLFSLGMLIILIAVPITGILLHLTFYDGWRHFYFLYIPIIWMSIEGTNCVLKSKYQIIRIYSAILIIISLSFSLVWIIQVHPYQIIYINPLIRKNWIGKFDRDYWDLSSKEAIDFLLEKSDNIAIHITDNHWISLVLCGFPPNERDRFHTYPYKTQPYPIEYLFFNYKNESGNEKNFDFYSPIYSIERDGIKLAEVFKRNHSHELNNSEIIDSIISASDNPTTNYLFDGNYDTSWEVTNLSDELIIQFKQPIVLSSIELFPKDNLADFPDLSYSYSNDGVSWSDCKATHKGTNGYNFSEIKTSLLKIHNHSIDSGIREILFYGSYSN